MQRPQQKKRKRFNMARFPQPEATKGSQKWIQKLINDKPEIISSEIIRSLKLSVDEKTDWVSPKREDNYAEYRDEAFLEKLGIEGTANLANFWPSGGPQWDALGRSLSSKRVFLVEAKAHIPELFKTRLRKSVGYSKSKSKFFSFKIGFQILLRMLKMRERNKN